MASDGGGGGPPPLQPVDEGANVLVVDGGGRPGGAPIVDMYSSSDSDDIEDEAKALASVAFVRELPRRCCALSCVGT